MSSVMVQYRSLKLIRCHSFVFFASGKSIVRIKMGSTSNLVLSIGNDTFIEFIGSVNFLVNFLSAFFSSSLMLLALGLTFSMELQLETRGLRLPHQISSFMYLGGWILIVEQPLVQD